MACLGHSGIVLLKCVPDSFTTLQPDHTGLLFIPTIFVEARVGIVVLDSDKRASIYIFIWPLDALTQYTSKQ